MGSLFIFMHMVRVWQTENPKFQINEDRFITGKFQYICHVDLLKHFIHDNFKISPKINSGQQHELIQYYLMTLMHTDC